MSPRLGENWGVQGKIWDQIRIQRLKNHRGSILTCKVHSTFFFVVLCYSQIFFSVYCHRLDEWGRRNKLEGSMVGAASSHVLRLLVCAVFGNVFFPKIKISMIQSFLQVKTSKAKKIKIDKKIKILLIVFWNVILLSYIKENVQFSSQYSWMFSEIGMGDSAKKYRCLRIDIV